MKKSILSSTGAIRYLRLAAAFACFGFLFRQAQAAESDEKQRSDDPANTLKFDPFTVTEKKTSAWNSQLTFSGSRIAENLMDVPINISIINEQFLKDLGAGTLLDALFYAGSGVNSRVSYRDDITIRGFRESPTRDGLAISSYGNTPLYDVERIEVVKGPTSLVYSNPANIGGTVNYVTKRPTATSQGDANFTVGIDNRYSADATQRGPLTADGRVRYRVTAGLQQYDGFRQLEYENNRLASASVDWSATKDLLFKFDAGYMQIKRRDFNRGLVDPATMKLADLPDDFTTSADWAKISTETYRGRIEGVYTPTSNFSVRVLFNSFENDYAYHVPQPFPGLKAAEAPNYQTIGQRLLDFTLHDEIKDLQADIVWLAEFGPFKNRITAGWAWNSNLETQTLFTGVLPDIVISAPLSARPLPPARSTWTVLTGPDKVAFGTGWTSYVQDALSMFKDRISITAGVRYVDATATTDGRSKTTPRYGFIYKPSEQISFYGGYAESYKPLTGFDDLGKPLRDIIGRDKELGVKLNLFGGKLFGSAAYFDILNDPVTQQVLLVSPVTGQIVPGTLQVGKQTNKGVEMDIGTALEIGDGELLGFATYYDADPRAETGQHAPRAVSYKGSIFVKYEFKRGSLKGFSFGGGLSDFGDQIGTGIPLEPGYTLYNAVLGYKTKRWSLTLNMDNLTNETDAIVGSEANFAVTTARPFDARMTYSYHW